MTLHRALCALALAAALGGGVRGDPCEPFHWHGFIGMEEQAVQNIVSWVRQPAP